ncbi:MAG TPA: acyltransferase [Terracidiphilus sp.]|nr:acyltransferase [Terracidiphilus sp.]
MILPGTVSREDKVTSIQQVEIAKPARLNALTGLRSFAAVNIVLFHFSNPNWFGPLAPVVNSGYASVSFFILLSGFVLGYNYNARARAGELNTKRFYEARFTRLYPIYLLSLVLAFKMIPIEWAAHTRTMFWSGVALSPLLLQGWIPEIATFLNTPAWTMSAESSFYVVFPWMARWKKPEHLRPHLAKMGLVWVLGMVPGTLYVIFNPDGLEYVDRFSYGPWLQALKFTPIPHLASFVFGVLLAELDEIVPRLGQRRLWIGIFGFAATFATLTQAHRLPYPLLHDSFFMPLFGCIILGLSGVNPLSKILGIAPLVFVGEASYCLYLLHFNMWNLIHDSHILDHLGLARFDPWISYVLLVGMALAALHFIEKPAQRLLRRWMHVWK